MQKSIESNFPEMAAEFNKALRNNKVDNLNRSLFSDFSKRKPFVEVFLESVFFIKILTEKSNYRLTCY